MKRNIFYIGIFLAALFPLGVHAVGTLHNTFCTIGVLVGQATPIVAGLALLAFFWGLSMYLFSLSGVSDTSAASGHYGGMSMATTPQGKRMGRTIMIYGIIVLFVMVSIWGIIRILQVTFDTGEGGSIQRPTISEVEPTTIEGYECTAGA